MRHRKTGNDPLQRLVAVFFAAGMLCSLYSRHRYLLPRAQRHGVFWDDATETLAR